MPFGSVAGTGNLTSARDPGMKLIRLLEMEDQITRRRTV
jgi:hypothetical protein